MTGPDFIEIGPDDRNATPVFLKVVWDRTWERMGAGPAGFFTDRTRKLGGHKENLPCKAPCLAVNHIEAEVAEEKNAGGSLMGEIAQPLGSGRVATCTDPRRMRFGVHQK